MSNVNIKVNNICKYTSWTIIQSLFFCTIESSNWFIKFKICFILKKNLSVGFKYLGFFFLLKDKYPYHLKHV
jgi:hypothetical protein